MKKFFLLLFIVIVLSFSVRAICCDYGCYPDPNVQCCGAIDGKGYYGCEATGNVFYCPQDDAVTGTPLPGGDSCLNCLCPDTYTCYWDDSNLCPTGETCLKEPNTGLPQISWCVNEDCPECGDCNSIPGGCTLNNCHGCYNDQCYYDPHIIGDDCYKCSVADSCSDFNDDPNACNGEITDCDLGNCVWLGNKCGTCDDIETCEDYGDINTCDLNPCNLGECLWDGSECFTIEPMQCDNDNIAERGETCDGTDLVGRTCQDFGFDGGNLNCLNCEYDLSSCTGYNPNPPEEGGTCGDGTLDEGEEACDCGEKKICTDIQLNYKTCTFFGYNGGVLSCYSTCEFDTRSCNMCDKDGVREIGETCDCGSGSCTLEQLNNKDCSDYNFASGNLGCDSNCEYDFSSCSSWDQSNCGDNNLDVGKEACDTGQLGGFICDDFDYFDDGDLACYDTCMFDTRKCELPDPDDSDVVCELKADGNQGDCNTQGESMCWDTKYPPEQPGECCGDDRGELDKWVNSDGNSCCADSADRYVFQTDPDYSSCFCNLKGDPKYGGSGNAETCDAKDEVYCWSTLTKPAALGRCCGDDQNEIWSYSSSYKLDDVLVKETCYNSKWTKRSDISIIFYDLTADLI